MNSLPADRTGGGRIWIQGAGELASGVAVRLFRSGFRIIMADMEHPRAVRRLVVFCEAVSEGNATVEGVRGVLRQPADVQFGTDDIGVIIDPDGEQITRLAPHAVIDARMTKKPAAPLPTAGVPLIGLGPGFRCGDNADMIIETHREARLGAVITSGEAEPATGIPGPVGGETQQRVLRSPGTGRLTSHCRIGDLVAAGDVVGSVDGNPLISPLSGLLRGLIHPDTELLPGDKVGDVDPRGSSVNPYLISDKALAVGGGVLEALLRCGVKPW